MSAAAEAWGQRAAVLLNLGLWDQHYGIVMSGGGGAAGGPTAGPLYMQLLLAAVAALPRLATAAAQASGALVCVAQPHSHKRQWQGLHPAQAGCCRERSVGLRAGSSLWLTWLKCTLIAGGGDKAHK